jgi:hypothetical protein
MVSTDHAGCSAGDHDRAASGVPVPRVVTVVYLTTARASSLAHTLPAAPLEVRVRGAERKI